MNSPISRAISLRVFLSLRFIRLSGAIDQLLFDSTVWWFEPAQAQLRREIIHLSFICAIFVSKPVPDCNDPAFGQLSNIKCGEAPATGQVVLPLFRALVLEECINKRLGIARIIRHLAHLPHPKVIASVRA
jgi:hypothetical protein